MDLECVLREVHNADEYLLVVYTEHYTNVSHVKPFASMEQLVVIVRKVSQTNDSLLAFSSSSIAAHCPRAPPQDPEFQSRLRVMDIDEVRSTDGFVRRMRICCAELEIS